MSPTAVLAGPGLFIAVLAGAGVLWLIAGLAVNSMSRSCRNWQMMRWGRPAFGAARSDRE